MKISTFIVVSVLTISLAVICSALPTASKKTVVPPTEAAKSNLIGLLLKTLKKNETMGNLTCQTEADKDGNVNCKAVIFDDFEGITGMRTFFYSCSGTWNSHCIAVTKSW